MTVLCIPDHLKIGMASQYRFGLMTINEMMEETGRSRCTIIRMLQEQGVYPEWPCMAKAKTPQTQIENQAQYAAPLAELVLVDIDPTIPEPEPTPYTYQIERLPDPDHEILHAAKPFFVAFVQRVKQFFSFA